MTNQSDTLNTFDTFCQKRNGGTSTPKKTKPKKKERKKQPCNECGKMFTSLNAHKCHGNQQHVCPHPNCGKSFTTVHLLKQHTTYCKWNEEKSQSKHVCEICNESLRDKYGLTTHIERLHKPKKYKCNFKNCNSKFSLRGDQLQHIQAHRMGWPCTVCPKKCSTKRGLKIHMLLHNRSPTNACDVCEKKFYTKARLQTHQKLHAKKKDQSTQDVDTGYGSQIQLLD